MMEFDNELDACGLNCPLPILRAQRTLDRMASGQVLKVVATDPGSVQDFEAFSRRTGHVLVESTADNGKYFFVLCKA